MKYINAKGEFVEEGSPESAYQVNPDSADGKRLIASLRGEKLNEPPVTTSRQFIESPKEEVTPEVVPDVVEEVKPKVTRKKRNG